MNRIITAVLATLLAGCAAEVTYGWVRPGATDRDFDLDDRQCKAQVASAARAVPLQADEMLESCMRGKGWHLQRTRWVGGTSFTDDDYECGGRVWNSSRGPQWESCIRERGWKPIER